jgi:hypothetical protein
LTPAWATLPFKSLTVVNEEVEGPVMVILIKSRRSWRKTKIDLLQTCDLYVPGAQFHVIGTCG